VIKSYGLVDESVAWQSVTMSVAGVTVGTGVLVGVLVDFLAGRTDALAMSPIGTGVLFRSVALVGIGPGFTPVELQLALLPLMLNSLPWATLGRTSGTAAATSSNARRAVIQRARVDRTVDYQPRVRSPLDRFRSRL
jgi:hypothetical protein